MPRRFACSPFGFTSASLLLCLIASPLFAAPSIQNVTPRALRIGHPTTLVIDGAELLDGTQVLLESPIASQTIRQASDNRLEVEVVIDASASPGFYPLRLANAKGISGAVAIAVDHLPLVARSDDVPDRPVAMYGTLTGGETHRSRLTGRQGERLVIDVESRRLGSQLRPVVRLFDPNGRQLAWSSRRREIGEDARLETTLPIDGVYSVELHDVLYRGAAPGFYRMKIGDLKSADFGMPSAAQRGVETKIELFSTDAGSEPVSDALPASIPTSASRFAAAPLPAGQIPVIAGQPGLLVSDHAELREERDESGSQTLPAAPIGVTGRLSAGREEDVYKLPVTPGSKLRFELFSDRIGGSVDGVVELRNVQGGQVARGDDQPNTRDPMVEFTVPENMTEMLVAVKDVAGQAGDEAVYRLAVTDTARVDFTLKAEVNVLNIPAGATQIVRIDAERRNYDGPITLAFEGIPSDVQVAGATVYAGQTIGLVSLTAPAAGPLFAVGRIVGRSAGSPTETIRTVDFAEQSYTRHLPWTRGELAFGVSDPSTLAIAWSNAADGDRLVLGSKLPIHVVVTRTGVTGKVRLRLMTTQVPLKKTVKQDNKDVEVDDVDRMLRFEAEPILAADAAEADAVLLTPADLPQGDWGLAIVAELLSEDEKSVVASAYTPVRRLTAVPSTP